MSKGSIVALYTAAGGHVPPAVRGSHILNLQGGEPHAIFRASLRQRTTTERRRQLDAHEYLDDCCLFGVARSRPRGRAGMHFLHGRVTPDRDRLSTALVRTLAL